MENQSEKVFSFLDNCMWIEFIDLLNLRCEYLLLAVNVLTNSPQTWHIAKRDFFPLNCLRIDQ